MQLPTIFGRRKSYFATYLQSYANWVYLMSCKLTHAEMNSMMTRNKKSWDMHKNREGIYKWFIENFSRRTYRCPVKKSFASEIAPDLIYSICNI